jgi:hypothetical protein
MVVIHKEPRHVYNAVNLPILQDEHLGIMMVSGGYGISIT